MRTLALALSVVLAALAGCASDSAPDAAPTPAPSLEVYNETWTFEVATGQSGVKEEDRDFGVPVGYARVQLVAMGAGGQRLGTTTNSISIALIEPGGREVSRCTSSTMIMTASGEGCRLESQREDAHGTWAVRYRAEGGGSAHVVVTVR